MDDESINKAEFLAEFFFSPLAAEVYKEATDKDKEVIEFANLLWVEVSNAIEQDDDGATEWS